MTTNSGNLTHLPISGSKRAPHIDFSSLASLASCQWRWYARYVLGLPDRPGPAAQLGTLVGELTGMFWEGLDWRAYWLEAGKQFMAANPEMENIPDWIKKAAWLMERYEEHYGNDRSSVKVLGTEVFFRLRLPGRYGYLCGAIDQIWEVDGKVWIREGKTFSDFSKMNQHERSHQTVFYMWAGRQLGYRPWGILLDGIRTYRWKRDQRPPADSFERRWLDRSDIHLDNAVAEAAKGLMLARELISGRLQPVRNINDHCGWCDYKNECNADLGWNDLVIPEEFGWDA